MKKFLTLIIILATSYYLAGCNKENDPPLDEKIHVCEENKSDWMNADSTVCGINEKQRICLICSKVLETDSYMIHHEYSITTLKEPTCVEQGLERHDCINCDYSYETNTRELNHVNGDLIVTRYPSADTIGSRDMHCGRCNEVIKTYTYLTNNYHYNGKLSVSGADLVNQNGEKFQLYGLSTHGIQWFGRYCNFNTIAEITSEFGINIIRFAFYTGEAGYCSGNEKIQASMLEDLHEGIEAATKLGLYVIIDWHMVGATEPLDKNPLTFLEESKEFFSYISEYYKDQDNILYEIMNEPNGSTTWADCKKYANEVIPCIRKNSDGIILVGNPRWTADLTSVMNDPLVGYENIMYTYHFYARDHRRTTQVENAYDQGFPVFISEFGFMNSDGDGPISTTNGEKWKQVLDSRNISYVAWNISNSAGSASIFKTNSVYMDDVSDTNLKEWGIYLKNWYRQKSGLA